jgi:hypothetical protein
VPLAITGVQGDPVLTFAATGSSGDPVTARVHSGFLVIEKVRSELTLRQRLAGGGPGSAVRLGCFVPNAGPFRPSHRLEAWAEASLGRTQVTGGRTLQVGPYGVDGATVQLVDDEKGSGSLWPYLWITVYGGKPMSVRYRLTVTTPDD